MTDDTDASERELSADLGSLGNRFADDDSSGDLYRALANRRWRKRGKAGPVALSWSRAERVVNDLHAEQGREPLSLAQTGGEGEVAGQVADALEALGWSSQSRHLRARRPPRRGPGAAAAAGHRRAPCSGERLGSARRTRRQNVRASVTPARRSIPPRSW